MANITLRMSVGDSYNTIDFVEVKIDVEDVALAKEIGADLRDQFRLMEKDVRAQARNAAYMANA